MKNIIRLAVLALVFALVGCANPCGTLRDVRSGTERGQPAVVALCACLAPVAAANAACKIEASLYVITDATMGAALDQFCSGVAFDSSAQLQTRSDFSGWLTTHGATRK